MAEERQDVCPAFLTGATEVARFSVPGSLTLEPVGLSGWKLLSSTGTEKEGILGGGCREGQAWGL